MKICSHTSAAAWPNDKESGQHEVTYPGAIRCTECGREWCCLECSINGDGMDFENFEKIEDIHDEIRDHNYLNPDDEKSIPDVHEIVCCFCSGKPRSWE